MEGVLPYGRQGDMLAAKSVSHRDFKWRRKCCPPPPPKPTVEREVHRHAINDIPKPGVLPNQVMKFTDDPCSISGHLHTDLHKLKKAFHWPINPITEESLGGSLCYHRPDDMCIKMRSEVWPRGEFRVMEQNPIHIPTDRCKVLAHKPKESKRWPPPECCLDATGNLTTYLKTRWPQPNWECWEEVPDDCKRQLPAECCFYTAETKGPDNALEKECPPKPACPQNHAY